MWKAVLVSCLLPALSASESLGVMGGDGFARPEAVAEVSETPVKPQINLLPQIVLKTQTQAQTVLGQPDGLCEQIKYGRKCVYRHGQVEIVYINGLADWITYNDPPAVGFFPAALIRLGIKCPMNLDKISFVQNGDAFGWHGTCPGFVSVQAFSGDGNAPPPYEGERRLQYIYLKAKTR